MQRHTAIIAGLFAGGAAIVLASETGVTSRLRPDPAPAQSKLSAGTPESAPAPIELAQAETAEPEPATGAGPDAAALQASLAEREQEIGRLRAELAARETELTELRADHEASTAELAELRAALEARETDLARLEGELKLRREAGENPQQVALPAPEIEDTGDLDTLRDDTATLDAALDAAKAPPAESSAAASADPETPLSEVHFEIASAALTPGGMVRALQAAEEAQARGLTRIRVAGHTDRTGSPEFNQRLSAARAETVVAVLVEAGLPRDMIEIAPMGESPDVAPIATDDGVAEPLNRCVGIYPLPGDTDTAAN